MNSIERVKASMRFAQPDRVPVWSANRLLSGDVFHLLMVPSKSWRPGHVEYEEGLFPFTGVDELIRLRQWKWQKPSWANTPQYRNWLEIKREEVDEWGCIWLRSADGSSMGHPGRPVLNDWSQYDAYVERYAPDACDESRYVLFARLSRIIASRRYRMCQLGFQGPFTTASAIRGFEPFMTDHYQDADALKKLLAHITDFYVKAAHMWVKSGAQPHGFIMYDDLGVQDRSFISPRIFREFYEPVYRTIFETVHALGCDMHFHSCGKIDLLIPDLIRWGMDALELDSPHTIGFDNLQAFRGRMMIWACVNIQSVYINGSEEECEREVETMVTNLGTPRGGFGAYFYPQPHHIKVPTANIRAFRTGLKKYGVYKH